MAQQWLALGGGDNRCRREYRRAARDHRPYVGPSEAETFRTGFLRSLKVPERLNKEVKRRADVVGIFPNADSIIRLIGAVLIEQNDDWQSQHRYMMVEAFGQIDTTQIDPLPSLTTQAA